MATADKLVYLDGIKTALREAINIALAARGEAPIDSNDTFRSYAERLFYPGFLFGQGEQGAYSLPPNSGSYFTDTAGTTPAVVTDAIARVNDESGNGANWTQGTAGSRPVWAREPEGGRRTLLTWSEDFANAAWIKSNSSVSANYALAPDGTTTADKLVEGTAASTHFVQRTVEVVPNETYALSVFLKQAERRYAYVQMAEGATPFATHASITVDLQDKVVSSTGVAPLTVDVDDVGDGWVRLSITVTTTSTLEILRVASNTNGSVSYGYTGDGTSGIYIWGAQLETGSTPTPYQRVTTVADVTEAGVPSIPYLSFDLSNDALSTTLPAGTYSVALPTRQGIWFDSVSHAGGAFDVGPTTYTGGPAGLLSALQDGGVCKMIAPPLLLNRALTTTERAALVQWYQSRGAGAEA